MRILRVTNWREYQHYHTRRAPWIKAYTAILDPLEHPGYAALTDIAKLTLHHVRLLAGLTLNEIPEFMVTKDRLLLSSTPRVNELVEAGFLEWSDVDQNASDVASKIASEGASDADSTHASDDASEIHRAPARTRTHARSRAPGHAQSPQFSSQPLGSRGKEPETEEAKKATSSRELVEGFRVSDRLREWAAANVPTVDVEHETEAWRDHFRNNGYRTRAGAIRDADAAWRNWMRNEAKWKRGPKNGTRPPAAPAADRLTGKRQPQRVNLADLDD